MRASCSRGCQPRRRSRYSRSPLFHGDILITYAVLGMVLPALRGLPSARAVRVAIGLVVVAGTAWTLLGVLDLFTHSQIDAAAVSARVADTVAAFRGTPGTVVAEHLRQLPGALAVVLLIQAPSARAMFLLGFAAGRERALAESERYRALWSWLLLAGLPVGLTGAAFYGYVATYRPGSPVETLAIGVGMLTPRCSPAATSPRCGGCSRPARPPCSPRREVGVVELHHPVRGAQRRIPRVWPRPDRQAAAPVVLGVAIPFYAAQLDVIA